jgi:VCBS repeat-containing protein
MSNVPAEGVSPATLPVPPDGVWRGSFDIRDPNGLPVSYVITHGPTLGELVMLADGSWTYTPTQAARLSAALAAPGTETRDTFSVDASDADGQVGGGGEILTVAPATLTLTHQIPVPATVEVFGAALSSDGKRIFIGDFNADDVVIVHTDDDSTQTVPLTAAGTVEFVALDPSDRTLYITQAGPPQLVAMDTSALTMKAPITVSQGPLSRMAVGAGGTSVYVGDMYGAKVVVIDTVDDGTHTIPLPASPVNQPVDMALGPDHTLWVACTNSTSDTVGVVVVDTTTYAVTPINLQSFQGAEGATIAASPDGSGMYVCQSDGYRTGNGHVTAINTATYVAHAVSVPGDPISAAVSTDGSVLYVTAAQIDDSGNAILILVDTRTEQVITTLTTTGWGARTPLISPDGVHIYVPQADGPKVEVYTLAGTGKWSA